jgi:hypothetical protein
MRNINAEQPNYDYEDQFDYLDDELDKVDSTDALIASQGRAVPPFILVNKRIEIWAKAIRMCNNTVIVLGSIECTLCWYLAVQKILVLSVAAFL